MHKFALTAATVGILSLGGIAAASAQYYGPSAPGPVYAEPGVTVYEGRNVYSGPGYVYDQRANTPGERTARDFMWKMPGDQAIINQMRANERSN